MCSWMTIIIHDHLATDADGLNLIKLTQLILKSGLLIMLALVIAGVEQNPGPGSELKIVLQDVKKVCFVSIYSIQ